MSRTAIRVLANDIHDPHGNYDYLADGLAAESKFYRIERQNGSLNFRILGDPWHGNITPLLAVDLDRNFDFLVARRSLLQLLYDDASAWLNTHDQRQT